MTSIEKYEDWWNQRIDGKTLSMFRVFFGIFLILDALCFYVLIDSYYPNQMYYFRFPFFQWWPRFSPNINQWIFFSQGVAGALLALGWKSRWAAGWACLTVMHLLLIDATVYLNHLVLTCLVSGIFIFLPIDRYYALQPSQSHKKDKSIARYELFAVIGLFWMSYLYGAIEKIRPEFLNGDIIAANMGLKRASNPLAQWLYQPENLKWEVGSVLALEILAPIGILCKKTRLFTLAALICFHIVNHITMNIGLFSFLMLASMVLYLDLDLFLNLPNKNKQENIIS